MALEKTNAVSEGKVKQANQVFIRNLSYEVTSDDLLKLFEVHGPVKNVSLVTTEENVSRGFGFVKFALPEDADNAIKALNGTDLKGRKLKLESAVKKLRGKNAPKENKDETDKTGDDKDDGEKKTDADEPKKKREKKAKAVKADNVLTVPSSRLKVLILGVPSDVTKKTMQMVVGKVVKKAVVELVKSDHELYPYVQILESKTKIMLVTVPSRKDITEIIEVFNNTTAHSLNLKQQQDVEDELQLLKKLRKKDPNATLPIKPTPFPDAPKETKSKDKLIVRRLNEVTDMDLRKRKCRVIVRNLSFLATEANVADKLGKFGPIVESMIPMVVVTVANNRQQNSVSEGKADEEEYEKEEIANAKKGKGGVGAGGEGEVVKRVLKPNERLRSRGFAFVTFLCEADAVKAVSESGGLRVCNREVAVDSSLGKTVYLKVQDEKEAMKRDMGVAHTDVDIEVGEEDVGEDEDDDEEGEGEGMDEEEGEEGEQMDEEEGEEGECEGNEEEENEEGMTGEGEDDYDENEGMEDEEDKEEVEDRTDDVEKGCTVFVRDLPFDANSKDLRDAVGSFGFVKMAVIVKDHSTGISKGSGFVKFDTPENAQACVQAAAVSSTRGLQVKDRMCRIDMAVDRGQAQRLKEDNKSAVANDKRNMYLANEGLIVGKGEESGGMSEDDRMKRQKSQSEKRKKLINPLFFVSAHRLSVRNLAKEVSDNDLKTLCINALKAGLTKNLVSRSDQDMHLKAQGIKFSERTADSLEIPPFSKGCVKTSKVMMDLMKVRSGLPQSRGYGFVEFAHHAHALACLRELNNNPAYTKHSTTVGKDKSRLILDFCLENVRKVMVLKEREVRSDNFKEFKRKQQEESENKKEKEQEKEDEEKKAKKLSKKELKMTPEQLEKKELKKLENIAKKENNKRERENEVENENNESEDDTESPKKLRKANSNNNSNNKNDKATISSSKNENTNVKKQNEKRKRDDNEDNDNENDDDESNTKNENPITKKSREEKLAAKAIKRKNMIQKRNENAKTRKDKREAKEKEEQINAAKNNAMLAKANNTIKNNSNNNNDDDNTNVVKKEKLANKFQKSKLKNAEISDNNQENKNPDTTTTTNTKTNTKIATKLAVKPVKKFDSKGNVVKEKGKGLGKKGVEVPNAPAAWGGFKRHRAKKLGKK